MADPYQMHPLSSDKEARPLFAAMRKRLAQLLATAHDDLYPGTHYAGWFDQTRTVIRTGRDDFQDELDENR